MRVLNSKIQTNQDSQSRAAESSSFMAGYTLETGRAFHGGIQIKHLTTLPTSSLSSLFNVLRTPQQSPHLPFATVLPTTQCVRHLSSLKGGDCSQSSRGTWRPQCSRALSPHTPVCHRGFMDSLLCPGSTAASSHTQTLVTSQGKYSDTKI